MNLTSSVLKNRAKTKLKGIYGQSILIGLIYSCIISVCSGGTFITSFWNVFKNADEAYFSMESGNTIPTEFYNVKVLFNPLSSIGSLALFLIAGPLAVGVAHYFLHLTDHNNPQIGDMFAHFSHFGNTFVMNLLIGIFTFLWGLLFIIPGIIAGISYAMAPYILAEHPEISASDAIKMSKQMMQGNKGDYFLLQLSFIGWGLLCILTFGIGFFFLSPYVSAANAEFFNEVSGKNVQKIQAGVNPDE